jgi:hypothetical protein
LTEDTIIIRTADHGELGLSHGVREKAYTVYEEMKLLASYLNSTSYTRHINCRATPFQIQDSILFTYYDNFFLPEDVPSGHIRAIRQGDWVYAIYYPENGSNFEYEMYNLKDDPGQLHTFLFKTYYPKFCLKQIDFIIILRKR